MSSVNVKGIKSHKFCINLNDLTRDARHLKRYVFSLALFPQSKVSFPLNLDRFLSFLCKSKPSREFYLAMHECVFFSLSYVHDR